MQKKQWITYVTLAALLILAIMVPVAGAYERTQIARPVTGVSQPQLIQHWQRQRLLILYGQAVFITYTETHQHNLRRECLTATVTPATRELPGHLFS